MIKNKNLSPEKIKDQDVNENTKSSLKRLQYKQRAKELGRNWIFSSPNVVLSNRCSVRIPHEKLVWQNKTFESFAIRKKHYISEIERLFPILKRTKWKSTDTGTPIKKLKTTPMTYPQQNIVRKQIKLVSTGLGEKKRRRFLLTSGGNNRTKRWFSNIALDSKKL